MEQENAIIDNPDVAVNITEQDSYFTYFDALTNNGVVMDNDLSGIQDRTLSFDEIRARQDYADTLVELERYYRNREHPQIETLDDILSQRIVATSLDTEYVSARSALSESRACRLYPPNLYEWSEFARLVNEYHIEGKVQDPGWFSTMFLASLRNSMSGTSNESDEQAILLQNLRLTLVRSGIVAGTQQSSSRQGGVLGRFDFVLMKNKREISMICETKTTQNLALPMAAALCVEKYNTAYELSKRNEERTTEWSNIAHPLGQLLGYMVDNTCRFGALTSGTRTYYMCISDDADRSDDDEGIGKNVMISDAWFVGQHNYLRAWAYIHKLGCTTTENDKWDPPKGWVKSTTNDSSPNMWSDKKIETHYKDGQGDGTYAKKTRFDSLDNSNDDNNDKTMTVNKLMRCCYELRQQVVDLPDVSLDKIKIIDAIGVGRNGRCFKVNWNGQMYAMKQFDIVRDGDTYFRKELVAYLVLKNAWGVLVPKPMFLSESKSGGRWFLGLQLGREPTVNDDTSQFKIVLNQLKEEYGIQHNDADGRNMIFITGDDGVEKIVAIDFEDWDLV